MVRFKKSRFVRLSVVVLSLWLLLSVVFLNSENVGLSAEAADGVPGQSLVVEQYYYIKNVHTGYYLDVYNANTSDGTSIIQWHFTGNNNQKWKLKKVTSGYYAGYYYFVSALSNDKVFALTGSTGSSSALLKLKDIDMSNNAQFFSLSGNNDCSLHFRSNSTGNNASLNVQGSSFTEGAYINQSFTYNSNSSWLIERVDYVPSYGINYAYNHWDAGASNHISTYPYLNNADCANFVSQCMVAAGNHYVGDWYIRKLNDTYPSPIISNNDYTQLNYSWSLSSPSPWISAVSFGDYWSSHVPYSECSFSSYTNNTFTNTYRTGDVVQLLKKGPLGSYYGYHTMYITEIYYVNGNPHHKYTAHTSPRKDRDLSLVCSEYSASNFKFRFYDFT